MKRDVAATDAFQADIPRKDDRKKTDPYIRRKSPPGVAHFYTVGTVVLSSLLGGAKDRNRQICIIPMWELTRGLAFVGAVLGTEAFYVPTFRDGVSFSSMFVKKCERTFDSQMIRHALMT